MLQIKNLTVEYGKNTVLNNISFDLKPHKITGILGRNGSGKSTVVSAINNLVPYKGQVLLHGEDIRLMNQRERAKQVAVLPQVLPVPFVTVKELVSFGRSPYHSLGSRLEKADMDIITSAMADTGVADLQDKPVALLSGGERQRAFLAMILAQQTNIIILDEPTTYMDMLCKAEFLDLLKILKERHKKTIMLILHDITDAVEYCDGLVILNEKEIAFMGDTDKSIKSLENVFKIRHWQVEGKIFFSV